MIERVKCPDPKRGELESPFLRGAGERPLRLTFHSDTLQALPPAEAEALEVLRDLARHPLLDVAQTEAGEFPLLEIDHRNSFPDSYTVAVKQDAQWLKHGHIREPKQWPATAARLVGQADPQHADAQAMLTDLLAARAHVAVRHDLFVTMSPWLLERRADEAVLNANPRRPSEAARIVGLFLRSRDDYGKSRVEVEPHPFVLTTRAGYYEVLVQHRLPNMWFYKSACAHASRGRPGDDTYDLAKGVITRCARALEARDAIGEQFYTPKYTSVLDRILYHFDYLTLLLAGALDAQARVAHRTYGIGDSSEYQVNFLDRSKKFRKALKYAGANKLVDLASRQHFRDVLTLLHELRNTIHSIALTGALGGYPAQLNAVIVEVPPRYGQPLWDAATRCGPPERWGLIRRQWASGEHYYRMEPYTYAVTLTEECFGLVDAVAAETEVTRLLPPGYPVAELSDKPREQGLYEEAIRKRFAVLG